MDKVGEVVNTTEREMRAEYRYTDLNYIFDVYMECEYRTNFSDNEYEGLKPGEFRFDYNSWSNRLGFTKKQMERAINELSKKKNVIIQVERGKRGTCSKYFLSRFEEKKKENNKEGIKRIVGEEKNIQSTSFGSGTREQKGSYKENNEEKKKEQSSKYINLSIISNNIYSLIFDYWISKNIKKHRVLTNDMKKAMDKTLKDYTQDEILESINNYSLMLNDKNYQWCNYQWSLNEFLVRKDKDGIRQLGLFLNDGSKYVNYLKSTQLREKNIDAEKSKEIHLRGWD